MAFSVPNAGFGHNPDDKEASWGDFTVTVAKVSTTGAIWTVLDPARLITTQRMLRSILGDAIDQHIIISAAGYATDGVNIGNNAATDDFGGANTQNPPGDGYLNIQWDFANLTAVTSVDFTNTNLDENDITVTIPYADVI